MSVRCSHRTFRTLIIVYLFHIVPIVGITLYQGVNPTWVAFDFEFGGLVQKAFGEDAMISDLEGVGLGFLIAFYFVSLVGMIWFRNWARWLHLTIFLLLLLFLPLWGAPVSYNTPIMESLIATGNMLLGAIFLMAFGSEIGSSWFKKQ
ncbi:MAG: hypothetical protein WA906_05350 [Pacificimonas sp.]